jgi:toxin YoeB
LAFEPRAFDDLAWWIQHDRKGALKLIKLFTEILRTPFEGAGSPEALKHELEGCWSRRIDREHRIVYEIIERDGIEIVRVIACRYHYA